jgi:hypothetical protein
MGQLDDWTTCRLPELPKTKIAQVKGSPHSQTHGRGRSRSFRRVPARLEPDEGDGESSFGAVACSITAVTFPLDSCQFTQCRLKHPPSVFISLGVDHQRRETEVNARTQEAATLDRGADVGVKVAQNVDRDLMLSGFGEAIPSCRRYDHAPDRAVMATAPRYGRVVTDPATNPELIHVIPNGVRILLQGRCDFGRPRRVVAEVCIDSDSQLVGKGLHQFRVNEGTRRRMTGPLTGVRRGGPTLVVPFHQTSSAFGGGSVDLDNAACPRRSRQIDLSEGSSSGSIDRDHGKRRRPLLLTLRSTFPIRSWPGPTWECPAQGRAKAFQEPS